MAEDKNHMTDERTVVLHTYNEMSEAEIMADKLEASGIKAFVHDENVMGVDPIAGVRLRVFEKDLQKAEQILKEE